MHLHEKVSFFRTLKGLTQEQMAEKLGMSTTGYSKIERGETKLQTDRLEKIVAVLGMELKDFVSFNEKMVFNTSFHDQCLHTQNLSINLSRELEYELEKLRLIVQQKDAENVLLREQINQLKEIIELIKKPSN